MDLITVLVSAAKAAAVPPALLLAICTHESGLKNVVHHDDGGSDSVGICQVKLATARMMDVNATEASLYSPKDNARYAALYLRRQLGRYRGVWSCAATAYNRGSVPHLVDSNNTNCDTKYSQKVLKVWREQSWKKIKAQGRAR